MPDAQHLSQDAQYSAVPPRRPDARFLFSHPAHCLALGFGAGLSPIAPGTAGTLWSWVAFLVLQPWLSDTGWAVLIAASLLLGCWACSVTARNLGVQDPAGIVWDEVVAFWIILWLLMPAGFWAQLAAFVLFRYFDAAKPGPVGWADRSFKGFGARGAFGILFDDLVAAGCSLMVLALFRAF